VTEEYDDGWAEQEEIRELKAEIARLKRENESLLLVCHQANHLARMITEYTKGPAKVRELRESLKPQMSAEMAMALLDGSGMTKPRPGSP